MTVEGEGVMSTRKNCCCLSTVMGMTVEGEGVMSISKTDVSDPRGHVH